MFDKLRKADYWSVLKGAGIAAAGAALAYASEYVSGQDFGTYGPAIAAGLAVLVNLLRKVTTA